MGRNPNGALLKKAEETGFEVLITMDSNMTFRLNLADQTPQDCRIASTQQPSCRYDPADAKNLADSALHRNLNGDFN